MPTNVKLEDGTEVEALTPEEVEAVKIEAIEQYKIENPDKSGDIVLLQEELTQAKEELEKAGKKDQNFVALREAKDKAERKLEAYTKETDGKITKVKMEVLEAVMQDHKSDMLKALSGGDAEIEKKIEYHYKRLGDVATTKEEITNKLKDAYVLATKQEAPDAVNMSVFSSGGVGRLKINSASPTFSSEEKELGAKFGLKEEDFKKK